jgi:hypothetical protein
VLIGLSITKSTAFRNSTQEFSNVYYYDAPSLYSEADATALIDAMTAYEKTFHSSIVTFVRGRVWTAGGTPASNNMIAQKNLSGTGARTAVSSFDKERAFLFRLRAGVDSRGNPVYFRKWFHACGQFFSSQSVAGTVLDNTTGFDSTNRASMVAAMNQIGSGNGAPGPVTLMAKSGRQPTAGATWEAHPFLEHHQLGDQWRAQ